VSTKPLTEHLVQFTRFGLVNAYLVREDDGFTLVDTTLGGGARGLIAAAKAQGGEIRRIVLTHGHSDHAGSLDALKEKLGSDVKVLLGELDARIHAGEKVVEGKLKGSWPKNVQTKPDTRLVGGERIGSLEVIATPGHTPGHVSLLDTRDRTLIAGDLFTTYFSAEIPNRLGQRFPLAAMGTQDAGQIVASARVAQALDPALLVAGHGPAVRDAAEAINAAIKRAAPAATAVPPTRD
jgi:glyoxylase-like metal-dependent hydrolase (beta-lactamase superfamily II)